MSLDLIVTQRDDVEAWQPFGYLPAPSERGIRHSVRETLASARADYAVELQPLYTGNGRAAGEHRAVIRVDTGAVLHVVGSRYTPVQTLDAASVLQPLVDQGVGEYDGCAVLKGGGVIVVRYKMPLTLRVPGDPSPVQCYLQVVTCHDGTMANAILLSTIRIVCRNTLAAALRQTAADADRGDATRIKIRHVASAGDRYDFARKSVAAATARFSAFETRCAQLAAARFTDAAMASVAARLLPAPANVLNDLDLTKSLRDKRERMVGLFSSGTGITGDMRGTAWAAVNAVSEYTDHFTRFRGATSADPQVAQQAADRRAFSVLAGAADMLKRDAMDVVEDVIAELC